jgi:hypothetical protein
MDKQFLVYNFLHFFTLFVAIAAGIISFRKLSTGQKIIFAEQIMFLATGIWSSYRIYNGLYSIPVNSLSEFLCYGIEFFYFDYELRTHRKNYLFRICGILLLSIIPLQWMIVGSLNYRGDSQIPISLYLIIFNFYCIICRPVNLSNMILRWALLSYNAGTFLLVTYKDYLIWEVDPNISGKLTTASYRLSDIQLLLITISFLMAYFQKKKTLQLQE